MSTSGLSPHLFLISDKDIFIFFSILTVHSNKAAYSTDYKKNNIDSGKNATVISVRLGIKI